MMSSELMRSPSMSKMQARMAGKLAVVSISIDRDILTVVFSRRHLKCRCQRPCMHVSVKLTHSVSWEAMSIDGIGSEMSNEI